MRVNSINFNTSFKSANRLGYGDDISAKRRNGMRQRIDDRVLYNVDYFLKEGRKSEFEEKKMIDNLTKKPKVFDQNSIRGIAFNVDVLDYDKNIYRGSCLNGDVESLKKLKKAGVETVIDFANYPGYKQDCEKANLKYQAFYIDNRFWKQPMFLDKNYYMDDITMYMTPREIEESADYLKQKEKDFDIKARQGIDSFVDFVCAFQKGNCYLGCEYGQFRTDEILTLEMLFDPQRDDESAPLHDIYLYALELYPKLTAEDKAKMGWTEEFDKNFIPKLKEMNEYYDRIYSDMFDED